VTILGILELIIGQVRAESVDMSRAGRGRGQVVPDVNIQAGMPLFWVGPHSRQKGRHEVRKGGPEGQRGV